MEAGGGRGGEAEQDACTHKGDEKQDTHTLEGSGAGGHRSAANPARACTMQHASPPPPHPCMPTRNTDVKQKTERQNGAETTYAVRLARSGGRGEGREAGTEVYVKGACVCMCVCDTLREVGRPPLLPPSTDAVMFRTASK